MTRGPSDRPRPLRLSASVQPSHPRRPEARRPAHGILSRHLPAVTALNHFIRETLAPSPAPGPPPPGRPPPEPSTTSAADHLLQRPSRQRGLRRVLPARPTGGRRHPGTGRGTPVPRPRTGRPRTPGPYAQRHRRQSRCRPHGEQAQERPPVRRCRRRPHCTGRAQPRPVTRLGAASPPLITFQPGGIPCQGGQDTNAAPPHTQSPRRRPSRATHAATARRAGTRLAGLPAFEGPTSRARGFLRARSE